MSGGQEANGKAFSLSFGGGKAGHRSKRVKISEEEDRPVQQYLTGFEQNGAVLHEGASNVTVVEGETKRVIPNQGNNFRGLGPKAYNPNRCAPPCSLPFVLLHCCLTYTERAEPENLYPK